MLAKPTIVITPGDRDGIGPEITWKALKALSKTKIKFQFVCVGSKEGFVKNGLPFYSANHPCSISEFGSNLKLPLISVPQGSAGFQAGCSIERAVNYLRPLSHIY
jgi:hypothetical protein